MYPGLPAAILRALTLATPFLPLHTGWRPAQAWQRPLGARGRLAPVVQALCAPENSVNILILWTIYHRIFCIIGCRVHASFRLFYPL